MPKLVDFEGVGTVEVPDDFKDSEISDLYGQLSQGRLSSAGGAFMRAGGEMAGNALSGAARITQAFPPPTHNPVTGAPIPRGPAVPLEEEPIYKFGQDLAGGAREAFPVNPLYADNLETAVASGAGSVVGLLPSALAGPAAPFVSGAAYGLSSGEQGAQEASQFIDNQIAEALAKGDEETAQRLTQAKPGIVNKTFAGYGAAGALSQGALGVAGKIPMLAKMGSKRGVVNSMLRGGGGEMAQEGGEQAIQNVTAKVLFDPDRSVTEGVGMSAGAGGIVGAAFGGGAAGVGMRQRKARLDAIRAERAGRVLNPMSPEDAALAPLSASAVNQTAVDAEDFLSKQLTAEDLGLGPGAEPVNPDAPYQPPVATGPVATVATPEEVAQAKAEQAAAAPAATQAQADAAPAATQAQADAAPAATQAQADAAPAATQAQADAAPAATVTAGTPTVTPTPEPPEVIAAQLALTASPESSKAVTLVTPGEDVSAVPEGLQVAETQHGTAIFNPQKTTEQQVEEAAAGDIFDPALLGMGAAVPQSDVAVTTTGPDGTRNVLSELVTEETVQQAMQAQQEAVPGGTTQVVPAGQVLQERGQGAAPVTTATQLVDSPTLEVPSGEIVTRPDLMQFKRMDEAASGVNEGDKLAGDWDDLKAGLLLLWEPLDPAAHGLSEGQRYIVANGHHRFEFGERAGRKGYNSQVLREADGFSASDALRIGSEVNIADGKGTVYDQAKFFRNTAATLGKDATQAAGRRIGARGRAAADIGLNASDDLFASFVNEQVTPEAARAIANAAPGDAGAQRIGIKFALQGKGPDFLANIIKASRAEAGQRAESMDLFGADDSAMKTMAEQAQRAGRLQKDLSDRISVLRAGKKVEIAKSEGIDVQNPNSIPQRIDDLKAELVRWEDWPLQPDLVAKVKGEQPQPAAAAPAPVSLAKKPKLGAGQNQGDLIASTQREDFALVAEKGTDAERIAAQKAKAAQDAGEAKAKQDREQGMFLTDTVEQPALALPSSPARVQLKSGPQTFTVEEQLPAQDGDQPGEVYFRVKNEKTGEVQTVESGDLKPVKQKPGAAVEADPVEALLTRAIDATNPRGKTHDFVSGVSHAVANAALKIARAVYIATRDMTAAVRAAVAHMRDNATEGFDEAAAEAKVRETLSSEPTIQPPAAAPGARTQESRGQFTGLITRDGAKQWSDAATGWIKQFNGDLNAATVAAIGGELPSDVRQFVFGQLLELTNQAIATTKNPIERTRLENLQERQSDAFKDSGALGGKTLAARFLAMKAIEHIMPVLLYRGLVRKAQLQAIPFTSVTSDAVRSWLTQAGRQAVAETREAMTKANAVVARVLKQQVSDYGQTWRDIVTASTEAQGNHRAEIFKRIAAHPTLQGLDQASQIELTNLLSDAWERERMKIFRAEFRKMVPLPKKTKEVDAKKLFDSIPDLVKQANLGLLDDAQFRDALAKRYGVASVNDATARRLNEMAQAAQKAPSGVMRSRILSQMVDLIQVAGGISKAHVLRDFWYAAVLSSPRTQVDNGMSLLNGALNTALASAHTAVIERDPLAAIKVWRAFFEGLGEAGRDFIPILKGERWRLAGIDYNRPASVLDSLQRHPNYVAKALGSSVYVGRMTAALDHLNTLATRQAMLQWAIHRSTEGDAREMMLPGPADIAAARERAVQEGTPAGLVKKRTREILEERISPELLLSATTIGQEAAYQGEPKGWLRWVYLAFKSMDSMPYIGGAARILSGTAFARYAINYSNDLLNYVAPVALFRWYVSATERQAESKLDFSPEQRDLILMKAALGTTMAAAAAAFFLTDDDDKKKRAIDINGSFRSLEGPKRNQLLAEGNIPYSIRIGDTYISYRQLPVAGVLGTIGEMRDRQKYQPDQWKEESVAASIGNGAIAGMFLVRDSAAISSFMDFLGVANAYKYDVKGISEKSVPRYVAKMLGSTIPAGIKDVDAWVDPSLYRGNSAGEYFLQQLPLARQLAGEGPLLNLFGEPVKADKYPWSRWVSAREVSPEWEAAGNLAARGLFLPQVAGFSVTNDDGTRRKATPRELYAYQREVGAGYKQFIRENAAELLSMDAKEAADFIKTETSAIRRDVRSDIQP